MLHAQTLKEVSAVIHAMGFGHVLDLLLLMFVANLAMGKAPAEMSLALSDWDLAMVRVPVSVPLSWVTIHVTNFRHATTSQKLLGITRAMAIKHVAPQVSLAMEHAMTQRRAMAPFAPVMDRVVANQCKYAAPIVPLPCQVSRQCRASV